MEGSSVDVKTIVVKGPVLVPSDEIGCSLVLISMVGENSFVISSDRIGCSRVAISAVEDEIW